RNFPISHLAPLAPFVDAVIWIKKAAALTHRETKRLDAPLADAIVRAADEVLGGLHRDHFVVDPYQAGAGTSHNMNCNEVLANRANELLGGKRGEYTPVHPNDHVNMAQSTHDVTPTALRLAAPAQLPAHRQPRAAGGEGPRSADAITGRRGGVFGSAADVRRGPGEDRERHPAARLRSPHRARRDRPAGGPAGLEHHAGEGKPVDRRDGEHG